MEQEALQTVFSPRDNGHAIHQLNEMRRNMNMEEENHPYVARCSIGKESRTSVEF